MRFREGLPKLPWPATFVTIGAGPGPRNVLALFRDGKLRVIPYMRWKTRPR